MWDKKYRWKGEMGMELPKAAGKVGVIEDDKVVYIEDYALQYIKVLRQDRKSVV